MKWGSSHRAVSRINKVTRALLAVSITLWAGIVAVRCHRTMKARDAAGAPARDAAGAPARNAAGAPAEPFVVAGLERLQHKPLMALYDINPWLMVIGSDVPRVTLYEDGLVIGFEPRKEAPPDRWVAHLSAGELAKFRERFEATGIAKVPSYTNLAEGVTDLHTTRIVFRQRDGWRSVSMRGMRDDGKSVMAEDHAQRGIEDPSAPDEFIAAYEMLKAFHPAGATPWKPESIEIMLWDFSYSKVPPLPWPRGVPAPPADATTREKVDTEVYHHFVPGIHEETMRKLLAAHDEHQAVEVNGRKWAVGLRVVLPEEDYLREVHPPR